MKSKSIIIALLLIAYYFSCLQTNAFRENLPQEFQRADTLMVSPKALKIAAPDFKGLLADYLHLRASIFLGGSQKRTSQDWETLYFIYKQAIELDPYFFQTAYYAQGFLGWRENMHEKAIDILQTVEEKRTWDWRASFYIGFDSFYFLHDTSSAIKHLQEASTRPNAPLITITLASRLAQETGQNETTLAFLQTLYQGTQDEYTKQQIENRIKAHLGLQVLENAISQYIKEKNSPPKSLIELHKQGYLKTMPENPFGDTFYYDPKNYSVTFLPPRSP